MFARGKKTPAAMWMWKLDFKMFRAYSHFNLFQVWENQLFFKVTTVCSTNLRRQVKLSLELQTGQ